MADIVESSTPQSAPNRSLPLREDCWSEDATSTLVDVWGRRFLELNRGHLRQKDWQEVADSVNSHHGHTKKTRRTDVQCKNRIDTLKKKYKIEKSKVVDSNGTLTSHWPFFQRLDSLIGSVGSSKTNHNQSKPRKSSPLPFSLPSPPMAVPLPYPRKIPSKSPVVLPQKRPAADDVFYRRNYSAVAAAAAKDVSEEEPDESDDDSLGMSEGSEKELGLEDGMRRLAKAIEGFGEIYERVEAEKQRQMVELEKQRMQFTKDLEVQRMQLFMDTQVHLEKIKRADKRPSGSDDIYS